VSVTRDRQPGRLYGGLGASGFCRGLRSCRAGHDPEARQWRARRPALRAPFRDVSSGRAGDLVEHTAGAVDDSGFSRL